jgi:hypothetical protein
MLVTPEVLEDARWVRQMLLDDGYRFVYHSWLTDTQYWLPRGRAFILRPLLRWRDLVVRDWARFCVELQVIQEGERVPWPRWALWRYGW